MDNQGLFPLTAYERPTLALANVLRGQPTAAMRAMVAPDTLSPNEMKRISDLIYRGAKKEDRNPVIQTVLDIATNPIFLIGAALSLKFPIPTAQKILSWTKEVGGKYHNMGPLFASLRSPQTIFEGTGVWDKMKQVVVAILRVHQDFGDPMRKALDQYKKITGHDPTPESLVRVALKLDGADARDGYLFQRMTKAGLKVKAPLVDTIRFDPAIPAQRGEQILYETAKKDVYGKFMDYLTKELKDPKARVRFENALENKGMTFAFEAATGRHYLPHQPFFPFRERLDLLRELVSGGGLAHGMGEGPAAYAARLMRSASSVLSPRMAVRAGGLGMVPHLETLEKFVPGLVNKETMVELKRYMQEHGEAIGARLKHYIRAAGKSSSWKNDITGTLNSMGFSKRTAEEQANHLERLVKQGRPDLAMSAAERLVGSYGGIPQYSLDLVNLTEHYLNSVAPEIAWTVKGLGKDLQWAADEKSGIIPDVKRRVLLKNVYMPMLRGFRTYEQNMWSVVWGETTLRALEQLDRPWAQKLVKKPVRDWIEHSLLGDSTTAVGGSHVATYFYLSTLGFNVSPAVHNLMQPLITTANLIGFGPTVKGLGIVLPKMGAYLKDAASLGELESMKKHFPEFVEVMGPDAAPVTRMMGSGGVGESVRPKVRLMPSKIQPYIERGKSAMLGMFSMSELFNRLLTFYSGRAFGAAAGLKGAEIADLTYDLVHRTQFVAGPLGMPPILRHLPAPLRQYMYFPMRYLDFITSHGLGTLGRVAATSTAAAIGAKNLLGTDLESGLMFGAMPLPTFPGTPFYPFPFVPPAVGAAGGLVQAAWEGDPRKAEQAAALMVPGGVALRRAALAMLPRYADWNDRTPDGRVPLYNEEKMLVGAFTPMQLFMKAIGLRPTDVAAEQELTNYLLKQRDQIRAYRRRYVELMYANDVEGAASVAQEFQGRYPELGPLQVKKADMKALETRRNITRVQRVLRGLPAEYRPQFQAMVDMSISNQVTNMLQNSPESAELLSAPFNGPGGASAGASPYGMPQAYPASESAGTYPGGPSLGAWGM